MKFIMRRSSAVSLLAGILAIGVACTKAPDDNQLTSQVQSKLSQDSGLQDKAITVQASGGVVTLSGTVDNEAQRTAAARYASAIPGITQVVNNLQTMPAPATRTAERAKTRQAPEMASASSKPRPSMPRRRPAPDSTDMAANDPPPSPSHSAPADVSPASVPVAQAPPPPPPAPKKVTVASGTSVAIRLLDPIDSEKVQPGQTFRATLDSPLPTDSDAVPSGYDVKGHIVDVKSAGKFAGQSLLVLELDSITMSGRSYALQTDAYRRQGNSRSKNTAEKVGAGAVIGAIIGGIAGGGKGAGIGAAAGGGVGGGVQAATKGQQIVLPSETVLSFNLSAPLTVTLPEQGPDSGRRKLDPPQ